MKCKAQNSVGTISTNARIEFLRPTTNLRAVSRITSGVPATDGAGIRMTRLIGTAELDQIDPFLLLEVFQTDEADDYIAGFPSHPHRGLATVT